MYKPVCNGGEIACSLPRRALLVLDGRVPTIYNLFHFLLNHGRQPQRHGINLKKSRLNVYKIFSARKKHLNFTLTNNVYEPIYCN